MNTKPDAAQQEDAIFGEAKDDPTRDFIAAELDKMEQGGEEDTGGLDQPIEDMPTVDVETVGEKEARKILSDAELGETEIDTGKKKEEPPAADDEDKEAAKDKAEPEGEDGDVKAGEESEDKGKDEEGDKKPEEAPDLTTASVSDLLDGVADDRKGELTRRLSEADKLSAVFTSDYAKEQMKQHGADPVQMAGRLVELATFAAEKPDEYIAWAAREMASSPDKVGDVLQAAAALHGYKVVKEGEAGEDDDLFEDPKLAAANKRIAELEAKVGGGAPEFGPDTPDRVQAREAAQNAQTLETQIMGVKTATNDDGTPLRPLWDHLEPQIAAKATAKRNSGQQVTIEDLGTFYDQAAEEMRQALMPGEQTPAAQDVRPVTEQIREKKADAAKKAKRASKTLDGAGQGTSRQPAIAKDAPINDVISSLWDEMSA